MLLNARARVLISEERDISILTHEDAFRVLFHQSAEAFRGVVEAFDRSVGEHGISNIFEALEAIRLFPSVNVRVTVASVVDADCCLVELSAVFRPVHELP